MGYQKEVYDRAWEQMRERAERARERLAARREEIRRGIPEIERIEREMAATAMAVTRAVIYEPGKAADRIESLRERNLELQEMRRGLLEQSGYPADYLSERHACPYCGDSGYVGPRMCGCLKELLKKAAAAQLGAAAQPRGCTFEDFSLSYYPEASPDGGAAPRRRMAQILEACRQYAQDFSLEADSLLMMGHTGLGKTHLSLAIASAVTESGFGVIYTPAQRLMDKLEAEKFSRSSEGRERYADNMECILGCDLLVLDDLGAEFHTQFTSAVLYNIINTRLVEGRPTVISTNLELAQIEDKYSPRMLSRLACSYRVLKFFGRDIRFIKKSEAR